MIEESLKNEEDDSDDEFEIWLVDSGIHTVRALKESKEIGSDGGLRKLKGIHESKVGYENDPHRDKNGEPLMHFDEDIPSDANEPQQYLLDDEDDAVDDHRERSPTPVYNDSKAKPRKRLIQKFSSDKVSGPAVFSQDLQEKWLMKILRDYEVPRQRYMAMMDLQERDEKLFYKLLINNVEQLPPVVYTPTVGEACQKYGSIFHRPSADRFLASAVVSNSPYDSNSQLQNVACTLVFHRRKSWNFTYGSSSIPRTRNSPWNEDPRKKRGGIRRNRARQSLTVTSCLPLSVTKEKWPTWNLLSAPAKCASTGVSFSNLGAGCNNATTAPAAVKKVKKFVEKEEGEEVCEKRRKGEEVCGKGRKAERSRGNYPEAAILALICSSSSILYSSIALHGC